MFWVCCIPWVRAENNTAIILNCCQQENMLVSLPLLSLHLSFSRSLSLSLALNWFSVSGKVHKMQNTFASVDLCYMLGALSTMQSIRDWPDWRNDGLTCRQWAQGNRVGGERGKGSKQIIIKRGNIKGETIWSSRVIADMRICHKLCRRPPWHSFV